MKVVAAMSMWDVCMEKGHRDLEQFEKVHRYISDQLFSSFVSDCLRPAFHRPALFPARCLTSRSREVNSTKTHCVHIKVVYSEHDFELVKGRVGPVCI